MEKSTKPTQNNDGKDEKHRGANDGEERIQNY